MGFTLNRGTCKRNRLWCLAGPLDRPLVSHSNSNTHENMHICSCVFECYTFALLYAPAVRARCINIAPLRHERRRGGCESRSLQRFYSRNVTRLQRLRFTSTAPAFMSQRHDVCCIRPAHVLSIEMNEIKSNRSDS